MENGIKKISPLLILFFLGACTNLVVPNNDEGDAVKVIDKVDSYKCKFKDVVVGTAEDSANEPEALFESAMRRARYNAAQKGATHVILQGSPQLQYDRDALVHRTTVVVNAYECKK